MQRTAGGGFMNATPLLEEEGDFLPAACLENLFYPFFFHRSGAVAAFPADYGPIDAAYVKVTKVLEQRLDRQEFNGGRSVAEMGNPLKAVTLVLDADAPPDMSLKFIRVNRVMVEVTPEAITKVLTESIEVEEQN